MFLLRQSSVLFVFLEMRFMCVSHDRSEEMSIPRYFAEDTDSSKQYTVWELGFCYVNYLAFRGVEFHVPFMTPAFKVVKIFLEKYSIN